MKGTLANTLAVLIGSGAGMLLRRGIPAGVRTTIMHGLALAVLLIGLQMALKTQNVLVVIISLVVGALIGEALDLDGRLNRLGAWLERHCGGESNVSKGFITASLVFCVGAMAVVGALQDGLSGDASTLYAKSTLDLVSSTVFASTMGPGVALAALPVFVYQGGITLAAAYLSPYVTAPMLSEMTAVGGLLIVGISLMMLDIIRIKVANLLPAIFVAALLVPLAAQWWH